MGSIRLTRRLAARILRRGENGIRIKPAGVADAKKALTRDDVRALISQGTIYAVAPRPNASMRGAQVRAKRRKGLRRGPGRRRGTAKARARLRGRHAVLARAQRRVLKALKSDGTISGDVFKRYYRLSKGGTFNSKMAMVTRLRNEVQISDERVKELRGM